MNLKTTVAAACLLLASCASRQEELQKTMDSWVGRPISEYALRFGPPASNFDMGTGRRAFQWQAFGLTPGVAAPIGGMMVYRAPQQTSCMVSLVASTSAKAPTLADWTIEQWTYQGTC